MESEKKPLSVLIVSRSFEFRGGVANYVQALVESTDTDLCFIHSRRCVQGWGFEFRVAPPL